MNITFHPYGLSAVLIKLEVEITPALTASLISIKNSILKNSPISLEYRIAYDSLLVASNKGEKLSVNDIKSWLGKESEIDIKYDTQRHEWEIPVNFDSDFAVDLNRVCDYHKISKTEFINRFLNKPYHVYMIGFLPGFPYCGFLDQTLSTPRLPRPRTNVQKGSVAIADQQTGIYTMASPGGWNIIGQTQVDILQLNIKAGDSIKYIKNHNG